MIYTSYFGNWRKFPKEYELISIARHTPKYFDIGQYKDLFPTSYLLDGYKNGKINKEEYILEYTAQLDLLNWENVFDDLDGSILLCYEKPPSFCHRYLVREWLSLYMKNSIKEL